MGARKENDSCRRAADTWTLSIFIFSKWKTVAAEKKKGTSDQSIRDSQVKPRREVETIVYWIH